MPSTPKLEDFPTAAVVAVDPEALRSEVQRKYADVAMDPTAGYHFNTGRPLAERLGYSDDILRQIPVPSVEAFAGIANPIFAGPIPPGASVLDIGSGGGFDSFAAAALVGESGQVIGVDMTPEMLARARGAAFAGGITNVEFREGIAEDLPVEDGWADVVISNGVLNLMADKPGVFAEINRVLKPGGVLQFGDIANGKEVPEAAVRDIDLWAA